MEFRGLAPKLKNAQSCFGRLVAFSVRNQWSSRIGGHCVFGGNFDSRICSNSKLRHGRTKTPKQTCFCCTKDLNFSNEDGLCKAIRRVVDGAMMLEMEPEEFPGEHCPKCLIDRGDLPVPVYSSLLPLRRGVGWNGCVTPSRIKHV
ncbi:hypothetical protein L484_016181 [Morus notabilis]|uniref:Uncharacterized protein n=1 Tax=Morus notabilis TaxID=981085 RepID=W9RH67_9ROSA|nr:hypothetical protein L484_016181 [Morus notabilis]